MGCEPPKPNLGALTLMTLSACNAGAITHETPQAIPAAPVVWKRHDDEQVMAVDHE